MTGGAIMRTTEISKPNMANLRGKLGREIIQTIRNTPAPRYEAIDRELKKKMETILAARNNGTY